MTRESAPLELPEALSRPKRRWSWIWLVPLLAVSGALSLIYASISQRGIPLFLQFQQGYGLKIGDTVRYRGVEIGQVHKIHLTVDLTAVQVEVRIDPTANAVAREDSRFWIVRPQIDISGAYGLDTMIGANYISVLPGQGAYQTHFKGLDVPPFLDEMEAGGLEIILRTPGRGNLRRGAPVSYREVIIGSILNVDLAKDASAVEVRVYIEPNYKNLIRENVYFWKVGSAELQAGWLSGISWRMDSLKNLLAGGVTMAVPPDPGKWVEREHRFELYDNPQPDWLEWTPHLAVHQPFAQTATERPQPLAVTLRWKYASYIYRWSTGERQGWVLPVAEGLLGAADLLTPPAGARPETTYLKIDDMELLLSTEAKVYAPDLVILPYNNKNYAPWPPDRQRTASKPEDTLITTRFAEAARSVTADHYQPTETGYWLVVDMPFDATWHGACVVAVNDGKLIGFLLVQENQSQIVLLPESKK